MHEEIAFEQPPCERERPWGSAPPGLRSDLTVPRVLLTGATGFLGGAFLAHQRAHEVEWILPARGSDDADARRRVWKRLNRFVDEATAARLLSRARVVRVDLRSPQSLT
ncbi:MAG: hypothetical protein JWN48_2240, partial [Myxococcaceae bacterium]|nr:hypothetical protein [Myxococcaceae bacterium]